MTLKVRITPMETTKTEWKKLIGDFSNLET